MHHTHFWAGGGGLARSQRMAARVIGRGSAASLSISASQWSSSRFQHSASGGIGITRLSFSARGSALAISPRMVHLRWAILGSTAS